MRAISLFFWLYISQGFLVSLISLFAIEYHCHMFEGSRLLNMGDNRAQSHRGRQVQRIAIDACTERGKGDTLYAVLLRQLQATLVRACQQSFIFLASLVDRPHSVKDIFSR